MPAKARSTLVVLLAVVAFAAPAGADDCSGGLIYDDGSFEKGYQLQSALFPAEFVMRLDPPSLPAALDEVCLCWYRTQNHNRVDFDLHVWAADGPGGVPGTLLGQLPGAAVTQLNTVPTFYSFDLGGLGIVAQGPIYVGPSWRQALNEGVVLCADESAPTAEQRGFGGLVTQGGTPPAGELGEPTFFPAYRALGVRARFDDSTATCFEDTSTVCLHGGRFRVEASWAIGGGVTGDGHKVRLTDDSAYFWFFDPDNVELVVKVLDACADPFNRFWVFSAGLTGVEVTLTVTDTERNFAKTYDNPLSRPYPPILDTDAFPTCP